MEPGCDGDVVVEFHNMIILDWLQARRELLYGCGIVDERITKAKRIERA